MQFNTARRPPCCRDEEPEGPSLQDRIYGTDPEFLSGAKKVLYGAVAANTEREFVVACISAIWPWLTRGLLFSAADAIDDATGSIARALTPEAIESLAQGLGIAGPAIDSLVDNLKKAREPRVDCVRGGCVRNAQAPEDLAGIVRSITPDGTALVSPNISTNEFADRVVVRVVLRGSEKSAVKLSKSDGAYFVEAPTSLPFDAFIHPLMGSGRPVVKCTYAGSLQSYGASSLHDVAPVVTWDGDTLVLTFNRAIESIPVPVPAAPVDKRAARIALAKKLAAEVGFAVPASEASDEAGKAAELDEYLSTADDVSVIHALSTIIKAYLRAYPERGAEVAAEFAPLG